MTLMQLTLDRTNCIHHPTACEGCLAQFLQTGVLPARGCLGQKVEDGRPEITIRIKTGNCYGVLVITEENREEVIYHGWMQFVQLPPEAFGTPPDRSEARDPTSPSIGPPKES